MAGTLFVVSTPIGNPDDLSFRALRVLADVSVIAAETPAETKRLLAGFGIATPIATYRPTDAGLSVWLRYLKEGHSVALICDAGTPTIADPGQLLIDRAHTSNIAVRIIPGPSAAIAALTAAAVAADGFLFAGEWPTSRLGQQQMISTVAGHPRPAVLFVAPRLLRGCLQSVATRMPDRVLTAACDLTTPHELIRRGRAAELLKERSLFRNRRDVTIVVTERGKRTSAQQGRRPHGSRRLRMNTR